MNKLCKYCYRTLPVENFPIKNGYYNSYCKNCWRVYKKTIYDKNKIIPYIEELENEKWRDIQFYEGYYKISSMGRVKSIQRKSFNGSDLQEKILKLKFNHLGYVIVWLTKQTLRKTFTVHRLVALHFLPNPENKKEVNHINGMKVDNRVENLEWCTTSENLRHAYKIGLRKSRKGKINKKKIAA